MSTSVKTENELIAEFMGYQYFPYKDEEKGWLHGWIKPEVNRKMGGIAYKVQHDLLLCRRKDDLKYHVNWDWLMPVVEKIESTQRSTLLYGGIANLKPYFFRIAGSFSGDFETEASGKTRIEAVYKAVLKFILWYNSQKQ